MCLAIVRPPGIEVPEEHIDRGWQRNPDGGGFAFVDKNGVQLRKGFFKLKDYKDAVFKAMKENPASTFLLHFRIRTTGDKSSENTHPHKFAYGVMIHNGTISGTGALHGTGDSDTALFLKKFGDKFTYERLSANKETLGKAIGTGNKLAFLYTNGKYVIVNEDSGQWREGVWYSNTWSLNAQTYGASRCTT